MSPLYLINAYVLECINAKMSKKSKALTPKMTKTQNET